MDNHMPLRTAYRRALWIMHLWVVYKIHLKSAVWAACFSVWKEIKLDLMHATRAIAYHGTRFPCTFSKLVVMSLQERIKIRGRWVGWLPSPDPPGPRFVIAVITCTYQQGLRRAWTTLVLSVCQLWVGISQFPPSE